MPISIAITGASGLSYALRLLEYLVFSKKQVYITCSPAAYIVADMELQQKWLGNPSKLAEQFTKQFNAEPDQIRVYGYSDWSAPMASGTAKIDAMVVCPCTSGCIAAIANGNSDNLIERGADVMIKENRPLILVHRETPLSAIHLENLLKLARLGVCILPANPGFYHQPTQISDMIDFVVARILDQLKIDHDLLPAWGQS